MQSPEPQYLQYSLDKLSEVARTLRGHYEHCRLCPHQCGVNRLAGETGFCGAGSEVKLGSAALHWGEEPPVTGSRGSGTLFFSHCTLRCLYCQNYPLSQLHHGESVSVQELAQRMLKLQKQGAHNLNWVTATHFLPSAFEALILAREKGLRIPVVYNTSGWESELILPYFKYMHDAYLADSRYLSNELAEELSCASDYVEHNEKTLKSIRSQFPCDLFDEEDIIQKGLIVRILMLPHYIQETVGVIHRLETWLGNDTYVSLMSQYFPAWQAFQHPHMRRRLTRPEYQLAVDALEKCGFEKGWVQDYNA